MLNGITFKINGDHQGSQVAFYSITFQNNDTHQWHQLAFQYKVSQINNDYLNQGRHIVIQIIYYHSRMNHSRWKKITMICFIRYRPVGFCSPACCAQFRNSDHLRLTSKLKCKILRVLKISPWHRALYIPNRAPISDLIQHNIFIYYLYQLIIKSWQVINYLYVYQDMSVTYVMGCNVILSFKTGNQ